MSAVRYGRTQLYVVAFKWLHEREDAYRFTRPMLRGEADSVAKRYRKCGFDACVKMSLT